MALTNLRTCVVPSRAWRTPAISSASIKGRPYPTVALKTADAPRGSAATIDAIPSVITRTKKCCSKHPHIGPPRGGGVPGNCSAGTKARGQAPASPRSQKPGGCRGLARNPRSRTVAGPPPERFGGSENAFMRGTQAATRPTKAPEGHTFRGSCNSCCRPDQLKPIHRPPAAVAIQLRMERTAISRATRPPAVASWR